MKNITFVTSNKNKLREFEMILGMKLLHTDIDVDEIQEMDLQKIIEHKAKQAYQELKRPVIVEDTGFYLDAWAGFPGPFIKWAAVTMGHEKLAKALPKNNRGGKWIAMCGFYDGKKFVSTKGVVRGVMTQKARGTSGWGFDPWFIPNGSDKTYAELGPKEKLKFSARKKALLQLHRRLPSGLTNNFEKTFSHS